MSSEFKGVPATSHEQEVAIAELQELKEQVRKLGAARFVGRINGGIISPGLGYEALQAVADERGNRSFLVRLARAISGTPDTFVSRNRIRG